MKMKYLFIYKNFAVYKIYTSTERHRNVNTA
jgi:hypothetical protein